MPTPGSSDRGARRIITGSASEMYWTDDHYQSFERIAPMSGLAGLLAHHVPSRASTGGTAPSRWTTCATPSSTPAGGSPRSTAGTAPTKAEFLAAVGEALDFPDYYGQNFDALADCLADVTAGDSEGWVLLWDGWGPLAREDERAFSVALSVLGGRVNADKGGRFAVLLRGEGPDIEGVPSLD